MTHTLSYLSTLKNLFSSRALLTLTLMICGLFLGSSSYAFELDSTNIESYGCLTTYTTCNFQGAGISNIEPGTFANHNNLTSLDLSQNYISLIESGTFEGLSSLQTLNLNLNSITFIESGVFAGLEELTSLDLSSNTSIFLESGMFTGLSSLQSLSLAGNNITSIESGVFAGLSSLISLNLSYSYSTSDGSIIGYNQIGGIPIGAFAGLSSLQSLGLDGNQISSIESGDFAGLSSLQYLGLAGNGIGSIESGDFSGLSSLQSLGLGALISATDQIFNWISSIESGDFAGLSSLTSLYLSWNPISSIESGDFAGLSSLQELNFERTQITSIESGDFAGLSSLQVLNFERNQISAIETGSFDGLSSMNTLWLQGNCLNDEDSVINNYLNGLGLPALYYYDQYVCVGVQYSPSTSTTSSVTGSLAFFGPTSKVNTLTAENLSLSSYDHIFTDNRSHLYDYSSMTDSNNYLWDTNFGGGKNIAGSVTWIDRDSPIGTLSYSTTGITNQSVIATLSLNELGSVTNNTGSTSYIFSGNGDFIFEYQDSVGHTGATTATVNWIDKTAPTITLNGSGTLSGYVGDSYTELGANWSDNIDGTGMILIPTSGSINTGEIGTYILEYTYIDTAGNTGNIITRTVTLTQRPTTLVSPSGGGGSVGGGSSPITLTPKITNTPPIGTINQTGARIDLPSTPTPITTIVQQKAYEWALSKGITTVATVSQARLDKNITRAELAKMLSVYATDVLGKTTVQSDKECVFTDNNQANKDLLPYITQVCELGIMGVQSDGKTPLTKFNPNAYVTRAEFGTVLSRVLYGTTNNTSSPQWREGHLNNLKKSNIINVVTPNLQEQRGWIMTMLYRTVQE